MSSAASSATIATRGLVPLGDYRTTREPGIDRRVSCSWATWPTSSARRSPVDGVT
jgi:hypothetical protein